MRDNLLPIIFFLFMVVNIYLDRLKRKRRRAERRQEEQNELPPEQQEPEMQAEQSKPDLAAEFERRLRKTTEAAEAEKKQQRDRVVGDRQHIHRDGEELAHDSKGRVHRDAEAFTHDKGKVYHDPRSDYSYSEEQMNAAAAAFNAHYAKEQEPEKRPRVQLKHKALVNGFIMSQVLDKPRALKPYEEIQ